jgi:hypothetical protein
MKAQAQLLAIATLAILSTMPANASFELTLLAENGSNAIRRVDPENRVVLGSFGANNLHLPTALAIDQANGIVYVANRYVGSSTNRITALNYNTGAFINEWSLGASIAVTSMAYRPGFGLYVPVNNGIRLYNASGAVQATFDGGGLTSIISVSYSETYNEVFGHDFEGSTRRYVSITSGSTFGISNYTGVNFHFGFSAVNGTNSYGGQSSTNNLVRFNHVTLSTTTTTAIPGFNVRAVSAAHSNRMYVGGHDVGLTSSYITTFDQQGNQVSDRWTVTGGAGIISMATVVAPEPGTMIALSAGILALLRRKKSAK